MKTDEEEVKRCLCLDCLYGSQPYSYFPIVCVHGKRSKDMWHEVFTCRHFEPCPDPPESDDLEPIEELAWISNKVTIVDLSDGKTVEMELNNEDEL